MAAVWPHAAWAQQPVRVFRIGCLALTPIDSPVPGQLLGAFKQGLKERGYVEGQNIVFEYRSADGRMELFPSLAVELVQSRVDLITTISNAATHAAGRATDAIPILSFNLGDPIGEGFAQSLARPGGNITGFTVFAPDLVPKTLGLLVQAAPQASRVAALWFPGSLSERTADDMLKKAEATARLLGVKLLVVQGRDATDLDSAFARIAGERADALLVLPSPVTNTERSRIAKLALKHRLPSISWTREYAEEGGLLAYGSNLAENWRQGAAYADRIFRGAKPADLPIQQPRTFELVVNARTGRALGMSLPATLLVSADEVIE